MNLVVLYKGSNETVAIVGKTGCGKSTIVSLLARMQEYNSGSITIDGVELRDIKKECIRKNIGIILQDPFLYARSVYDNILYGKLDATEDEVLNAAKNADISNLINDDDKDRPLSGGEKQRVAIARAFLKNPSIILMDEATSALDKETENEVQKNIIKLQEGKTSITVAHRLSTIIESDIIFVLDSGEIVEKGTHEELLKLQGKYYTLYKYSGK